ncbi:MAG: autotransporter strand-loop-strand O-heptosyltransferase [Acetobacteraceae bacterium]|nr:autotransporter strand-loop-strand O-heptosyltransferase [Acetobacteraceae bacterium]
MNDMATSPTAIPAAAADDTDPPRPGPSSAAAGQDVSKKRPYPPTAVLPTQDGPSGIRFDFNEGARVLLPPRTEGRWRIRIRDRDTGNILFQTENQGAQVRSSKRFFVRFGIEVWTLDEAGTPTLVLTHDYDARDREVLIQFPVGTLGDTLAWFPYAARFAAVHRCRLTCAMSDLLIPLLRDAYPDIRFVTHDEVADRQIAQAAYATYYLGLFFDDADCVHQPTDFRQVGLHRTAGYILGVDPAEAAPRLGVADEGPPIADRYVCIAVQSSTQSKYWTNPDGWRAVVAFLKASGYRVICIDQKPVHGAGIVWNHIPHGAEDETGDRPLAERVRWLRHASAFIGLSSGLSWLAWAAGTKVVLISGFTHPTNEFATPYRVINWHACNSCWNDVRHRFDHNDFLWCPRHAGTPRQFECTRLITAAQVIAMLERIPGLIAPKQT